MTDYFSEYSSFVGANKGLPSPADTPYETPGFIRSKRTSRATLESSREHSQSPPPLPPDTADHHDKGRDGRYTGLDPRRFTPTLHASLVAEILSLRREIDSKNGLVENLETSLSSAKHENEKLNQQLSESSRETKKARHQVQQMERGAYDALEDLVKQRDTAQNIADGLRIKLEAAQKKVRQQDDDAERTQSIWETDKESWENERRQLERRIHVTDSRLRTFVEEINTHQISTNQNESANIDDGEITFKDSGIGNENDTASIRSASPTKHRRNVSSISMRPGNIRSSFALRPTSATPDLYARPVGNSLADELGGDEEDRYDEDDIEGEEGLGYPEPVKRGDSRQSIVSGDWDAKAKRVLGFTTGVRDSTTVRERAKKFEDSPSSRELAKQPLGSPFAASSSPKELKRPVYVDSGYQPSPPPSPPRMESRRNVDEEVAADRAWSVDAARSGIAADVGLSQSPRPGSALTLDTSPMSPPQTPVINDTQWTSQQTAPARISTYCTASTQTDFVELERSTVDTVDRDDSAPSIVPSIAIHPPGSRPPTPHDHVLPPGTKSVGSQASLRWPCRDASVQTEEIRIDRRAFKLPPHLLPAHLLPSPVLGGETRESRPKRSASGGLPQKPTNFSIGGQDSSSPPIQSPTERPPALSRDNSSRDLRNLPLKAIPLPKPVLSPTIARSEMFNNGPLNRSAQYGVTQVKREMSYFPEMGDHPESSKPSELTSDIDTTAQSASALFLNRAPQGRFGLSEPPRAVPEDKEISSEQRSDTADSYDAVPPVPAIPNNRTGSRNQFARPLQKPHSRRDFRSRSPSFGSMASSSYSAGSARIYPPYPIPMRSSSRIYSQPHSEGSRSPSMYDPFGPTGHRSSRASHARQQSLRKVKSAAVIRNKPRRNSPNKHHRSRRRSPELTPVQSMAFESPAPANMVIPELPTPLQNSRSFEYVKTPVNMGKPMNVNVPPRVSAENDLVDGIAATMVGEWMWKYVRKWKSFGVGEDSADNRGVDSANHGTRHKRWVWLSPYERTIMWDTKQPTSGSALLGKKGRKLVIQSVLDVHDPTPLPKGAELASAFHRSILILTPERALKFTATTRERHALWMTALSFLANAGQLPLDIPPPSPMEANAPLASIDSVPIKRYRAPSFGRANVRDSIRLAKGKRPEHLQQLASRSDRSIGREPMPMETSQPAEPEGAEFPSVPRLYVSTTRHQRKRSNTSPRIPQPLQNLRSFSSSAVTTSAASSALPTSSLRGGGGGGGGGGSFPRPVPSASSKSGGSRRDSITSPDRTNSFEVVGTVRMDAFVDPNVRDGVLYVPAPPPHISGPRRHRGNSSLSQSTLDKRRAGYIFDEEGFDPFKGF